MATTAGPTFSATVMTAWEEASRRFWSEFVPESEIRRTSGLFIGSASRSVCPENAHSPGFIPACHKRDGAFWYRSGDEGGFDEVAGLGGQLVQDALAVLEGELLHP